jgi:hypothetical protein
MGFEGDPKGAKITTTDGTNDIPLIMTKFPEKNKDSVQLFMPLIKTDSLVISVEKGDFKKTFVSKIKEQKETDSLKISPIQKGTLHFRDSFKITATTPLKNINQELITLLNKDSIKVAFDFSYNEFEQEIKFDFKKDEDQKYQMEFLPNAFEDIYGIKNDTLSFVFNTKSLTDYGNLQVNLKSAKRFPLLLEILTVKGEVVASAISKGEKTLTFDALEPNIYKLRIIYDDNGNGIWDTGSYLDKRQAEEIQYYPKEIDVRANWDVEQEF